MNLDELANSVAGRLPYGFFISISIERGSGSVEMEDAYGSVLAEQLADESLTECVERCVEEAREKAAEAAGGE